MNCPNCGSTHIAGLVAAFWVTLDEDGNLKEALIDAVHGNTEIGPERQCSDCNHEWEED